MNKTERGFAFAKQMAMQVSHKRARIGCAVIYKGKLIGTGQNMIKEHPVQHRYNKYRQNKTGSRDALHAEIAALYPLVHKDIDWKKAEVFIYRACTAREHGMARPCPACMRMIRDLGIRKIHYTTDNSLVTEYFD